MSWRDRYIPLIARVLSNNQDASLAEKRKLLRAAFPDGPREYHPYKIWLNECAVQLGLKKVKTRTKGVPKPIESTAGQKEMF